MNKNTSSNEAIETNNGSVKQSIKGVIQTCKENDILTDFLSGREEEIAEIIYSNYKQQEIISNYLESEKRQTAKEIAIRLHERSYSVKDISDLVGYSIEDVNSWICSNETGGKFPHLPNDIKSI